MLRQDFDDRKAKLLSGLLRRKVLVVDEDFDGLLYYSAVLRHHGYEVRSIPSYSEGATCLEGEDYDLIIVSQGSSNFEGRRVLARAIEKDRHTPVLVFTRSVEMSCYLEAIQSGAIDYIEKPLPPSEIGTLVAKHLRTHLGTA
ncbi:MAG TPA: response regulator [Terriglobia bacterium]|nr:response regulator [Terriglobia bacterium]